MQRNFRWALSDQEGMSYLAKKTKKCEAALILSNVRCDGKADCLAWLSTKCQSEGTNRPQCLFVLSTLRVGQAAFRQVFLKKMVR